MKARALLVAALAACGNTSGAVRPDAEVGVHPAAAPAAVPFVKPGFPHALEIDRVILSPDGASALTRDNGMRVRLWPKLDGSAEPMVVPLSDAIRLSFARRSNGFTIAALDAAGAGRVIRVADDGAVKVLAHLPPD